MKRRIYFTLAYLVLLVLILIVAAQFFQGTGNYGSVSVVIFYLWLGPLLVFISSLGSARSEWDWFRRKFRRSDK
jgi:hypothetical protein